jgi:hypothetical protein
MQTLATIAARPTTLIGTTDRGPGCGAQDFSNTGSCMPGTTGRATGAALLLHPVMRAAATAITTSACRALSPALTAYAPSCAFIVPSCSTSPGRPALLQSPCLDTERFICACRHRVLTVGVPSPDRRIGRTSHDYFSHLSDRPLVTGVRDSFAISPEGLQDLVGGLAPHEGPRILVPARSPCLEVGLERLHIPMCGAL